MTIIKLHLIQNWNNCRFLHIQNHLGRMATHALVKVHTNQPWWVWIGSHSAVASQSARANLPVYYSKQNETANYHFSCRIICVFPLNEGRMPLWVPVKTGWGLWQTPCKYSCSIIVVSAGCDMHVVNGRCPHNWCYPLCCPCNLHPPTPGALQVRLAAGCLQPRPRWKTSSRLLEPSTWFPFKNLSN